MENLFIAKCPNGHQVYLMCVKKDCAKPSGICERHGCPFESVHDRCNNYKDVKNIFQSLMDFAQQRSQKTDQYVIGTINKIMKNLETLKNEYLNKSRQLENHLKGKRKQLVSLMRNGPADNITSRLLNDVLEGNEQPEQESETLEKLKEIVERVQKQHKEGLKEIRRWITAGDKFKWMFDYELTNKHGVEITNEGRKIQNISNRSVYSMITPSIMDSTDNELILRPLRMRDSALVGIQFREKLKQSDFYKTKNLYHNRMVSNNGIVKMGQDYDLLGYYSFGFNQGDILVLKYDQPSKRVLLTCLLSGRSISFECHADEEIHYCVLTDAENDEWEILEEI